MLTKEDIQYTIVAGNGAGPVLLKDNDTIHLDPIAQRLLRNLLTRITPKRHPTKKHQEPEIVRQLRESGFKFDEAPASEWTFKDRSQI